MTIYVYTKYRRSYKNLDQHLQELVNQRIALFKHDLFDPRLDTHRLHGKLKNKWSFSVDGRNRVLFEFLNKQKEDIVFLDVGDHSIYK